MQTREWGLGRREETGSERENEGGHGGGNEFQTHREAFGIDTREESQPLTPDEGTS